LEEEDGDVARRVGPARQRDKEEIEDTDSVRLMGRGWFLVLGQICPRGPFSIFIFFSSFPFLFFLISFVSLAKMLQFKSNQFLKFYKIHSKVLNQ
jgi:hypothetical protein